MWRIISCLLLFITCSNANNLEHDGWVNIKLEHALSPSDPSIFTERGNITIQSLRIGLATVDQKPITPEERADLRQLAAKNLLYRARAIVAASDGSETTFLTTVKACMLVGADLDDRFSIALDYSGRVVGVTLVIASKSTCEGTVAPFNKLKEFTTSVHVRHSEVGPSPDVATYIQKMEREREARERGEVKDNRSILSKYWMYIVPFVILLMISSMANPEAAR